MFFKICTVFFIFIVTSLVQTKEAGYLETVDIFRTYSILESLQESSNGTKCGEALLEYLNGLNTTQMWALTSKYTHYYFMFLM